MSFGSGVIDYKLCNKCGGVAERDAYSGLGHCPNCKTRFKVLKNQSTSELMDYFYDLEDVKPKKSEQDYRKAKEKGLIICGFAGIGKSTLSKYYPKWVDLESTPFNKLWKVYVDVIEHMSNNGYNVMVSCHKELREELYNRGLNFIVVCPNKNLKEEYLERYTSRGNTESFITMMEKNFESFVEDCEGLGDLFLLEKGEFLEDIINEIL